MNSRFGVRTMSRELGDIRPGDLYADVFDIPLVVSVNSERGGIVVLFVLERDESYKFRLIRRTLTTASLHSKNNWWNKYRVSL